MLPGAGHGGGGVKDGVVSEATSSVNDWSRVKVM